MGRFIFWTFVFLIVASYLLYFQVEVPFVGEVLGKLPGDIVYKNEYFTVFLPFTSSILASIIFSFVLSIIFRR